MTKLRKRFAGILQQITWLNDRYTRWKWRERKVSYGAENPEHTFFVARRANCKVGLFSLVMTNMGLVKYALDRGYIPVIDMQSGKNTYLEEEQVGKINAWELYFQQPCGYELADIAESRNVILSSGLIGEELEFPDDSIVRDKRKYLEWRKLFDRYFIVKEDIKKEAEEIRKELLHGERTLGVLCRGTDYVNTRPKGHPVQPTIGQMVSKVREVMKEQQCTCIYLTTEDADIFAQFRKEFGPLVKSLDIKRYSDTGTANINDIAAREKESRYMMGKKYLLSILILSECDCLVAGSAGGTHGALLMGKEYDYQYIFDLGVY